MSLLRRNANTRDNGELNMRKNLFLCLSLLCGAGVLIGQESAELLIQKVNHDRANQKLSLILVDKSIASVRQTGLETRNRLAELFFYRGEILTQERRLHEAVAAFDSCIDKYASSGEIRSEACYQRAVLYDTIGAINGRTLIAETLIASQLAWSGQNAQAEHYPVEYRYAERDYSSNGSLKARQALLELYLVEVETDKAGSVWERLTVSPGLDVGIRTADEILLREAHGDLAGAERLEKDAKHEAISDTVDSVLKRVRGRRMVNLFAWGERIVHGFSVTLAGVQSEAEPRSYAVGSAAYSFKRLLFQKGGSGFLVSSKNDAFIASNRGRGGFGAKTDLLMTALLDKTISLPGFGGGAHFKSYRKTGLALLNSDPLAVFETSEWGYGGNLNGGIQHKLFGFLSVYQNNQWLNDLSAPLAISDRMFHEKQIRISSLEPSDGKYTLGEAGTGWWPEKSKLSSNSYMLGVNTNWTNALTLGCAFDWYSSELADQDEQTGKADGTGVEYTYVHDIVYRNLYTLFRLNGQLRFKLSRIGVELGGHHHFQLAKSLRLNYRTAEIVQTIPDLSGTHTSEYKLYAKTLDGPARAFADEVTGIFPSVSEAYMRLGFGRVVLSIEGTVHGLTGKNGEITVSLGLKSAEKTLSRCLHDLAFWR
jgi:hypothetical protein